MKIDIQNHDDLLPCDIDFWYQQNATIENLDSLLGIKQSSEHKILKLVIEVLEHTSNPDELLPLFNKDETFIDLFGSDPLSWKNKIQSFLDKPCGIPSEEGMKLQDFLRWGLLGPFALVAGEYLKSQDRVLKQFNKLLYQLENDTEDIYFEKISKKTSFYLPNYGSTIGILKECQALKDMILDMVDNIEKYDQKKIDDQLIKIGIRRGRHYLSHTDWKAVGGSMLGNLMLVHLTQKATDSKKITLFMRILGTHYGARFSSEQGAPIKDRGWTDRKQLIEAITICRDLILDMSKFKNSARSKKLEVDSLTDDQQLILKSVDQAIRVVFNGYKEIITIVSRGLAAL